MVLAGCAAWLAVLGWVDRATGYELGLFALYTAPIGVVAWNLGRGPGIMAAFIASVIWYVADRYAGDRYTAPFFGYWNTGMHFASFIINAVTFAEIKSGLDQRHELERALVETREQLRQVASLTPLCPQCRKPFGPQALSAQAQECLAATNLQPPPACRPPPILENSFSKRRIYARGLSGTLPDGVLEVEAVGGGWNVSQIPSHAQLLSPKR